MEIQRIFDPAALREVYRDLKSHLYGNFAPEQISPDFFECGYLVFEGSDIYSALVLYNNPHLELKANMRIVLEILNQGTTPKPFFCCLGKC